jgi:site-specific recombinase XerC
MSERAITKRVAYLGARLGIKGLSAHDLRHSWAIRASRAKTDAFALQEGAAGTVWTCRAVTWKRRRRMSHYEAAAGAHQRARNAQPGMWESTWSQQVLDV